MTNKSKLCHHFILTDYHNQAENTYGHLNILMINESSFFFHI